MKAILIVDIDANELPKDARANVYVFGKYYEDQEDDFIALKENVHLKPMPQKKEITESMVLNQHYQNLVNYNGGWNNCIDEILGEEE